MFKSYDHIRLKAVDTIQQLTAHNKQAKRLWQDGKITKEEFLRVNYETSLKKKAIQDLFKN